MRRILVIVLTTMLPTVLIVMLVVGLGLKYGPGLLGSGDSPDVWDKQGDADFRTVVKTQLLTQPGMSLFCQAIRGSSDKEVLALMVGVIGQDQAKVLNINPGNDAQLHGAAILKEECARLFGDD